MITSQQNENVNHNTLLTLLTICALLISQIEDNKNDLIKGQRFK